jgi:hypothetical protein
MLEALKAASDADMASIQQAYEVLTRIGNATAAGEVWDEYIDRAHQDLGLLLAVRYAHEHGISDPPTEGMTQMRSGTP